MNLFDTENIPTVEPEEITAGDFVTWLRTDLGADYPVADYTLEYEARLEGAGATVISITATANGSDFLVSITSVDSLAYTPGRYQWDAYIYRNSDDARKKVGTGAFNVKPDRASSTVDPRSPIKIALDQVEANPPSGQVQSYSIASPGGISRTVSYRTGAEWLAIRNQLSIEYQQELNKEKIKTLGINPRNIYVRFARP